MNHKQKTWLFKLLNLLPERLGYYIYHRLQDVFTKQTLEDKIKSTENSWHTVERILKEYHITLQNKHIIEIGSGWLPIFPYFLKVIAKVNSVNTYDINKHYNPYRIKKLNKIFSERFTISPHEFIGRYNLLNGIHYFPKTPVQQADLSNKDLIISRFVLEHIPEEIIASLHKAFFKDLKSGSHILHLISPSDHRAYADKQLSLYDFLKYSQKQWDGIQTKFDYHNRLRLPQYLALFKEDFEIISIEYQSCKKGSEQYDKFKELTIQEDFTKFTEDELTAGSINILMKKL